MPREKKSSLKNKNNCSDVNDSDIMTTKSGNTKKRRTSNLNNNNNQNNSNNVNNNNNQKSMSIELIPPQPIGHFGDTIYASNPFDDTPRTPMSGPRTPQPMPPNGGPGMAMMSGPQSQQSNTQSPNPMINNNNNVSMPSTGGQVGPKPVPLMSGKIYPPEQSMVFNPANPNAPPIYPCGICHKEVHDNDQAILCESGCNFWFHRICSGLSDRAFFLLNQEVYAEWVCDKCLQNKSIPLVKFKP